MNKKKEISKSDIFYLVILILSLMIMISSITIAYFSMMASQEEDDTKLYTANAIESIIVYGLNNGYRFEAINENTTMITHKVNN